VLVSTRTSERKAAVEPAERKLEPEKKFIFLLDSPFETSYNIDTI
jgi:hypothetical protein